jgi:hypothetical protein
MPNGPTTKFKFPDGGKFFYGEKAGLARDGTGRIHFLLPVVRETDDGKRMPRFLHGVSKEDGWDLRSFGDALDGDASGTFGFHDYEMSELVIDDSGMVTFAISSTWDYTFGATDADGKWRIASPRRSKWTLGKGVERGAVILGK